MIIDVILLVIIAGVTWCVASEGAWGAGLNLLCVLLAGLIAMNFFEPMANMFGTTGSWSYRGDIIALVGLFEVSVFVLREVAERISPRYIQVNNLVHNMGRWLCGLLAGYMTAAFLLTALHTAPLPREFLGFSPERGNLFGVAPDRQWLGFTQHVSEKVLYSGKVFDGPRESFGDYPNDIWPSFPIRYASRRDQIGGSAAPAGGAAGGGIRRIEPTGGGGAGGF